MTDNPFLITLASIFVFFTIHDAINILFLFSELKVRIYNDQLMNFERIFIHETGHHGTKSVR